GKAASPEEFHRSLMLDAKLSIAEPAATAPPPAWIERIVETASNCALTEGGPMSNPSTAAPAWQTAATPCPNSGLPGLQRCANCSRNLETTKRTAAAFTAQQTDFI